MITILLIAALGVVALIATVVELPRDGYRRVPTDRTRLR